jgi:ABC-type transport system involved in multi-copper enzyme maturation permease subunit
MNPMVRKELNLRMRERRGWILPTLYLLGLGATVIFAYYMETEASVGKSDLQGATVGATAFVTLSYTQLALLLILVPVFSAGSLTLEKEQRTLAGLVTSLLRPWEIWFGKLTSAVMFVGLLLCTGVPVMALALSLGGVGVSEMLFTVLTTLIIVSTMATMGLYFSATFRRSVHSTAVTYGAVIVLSVVTVVIFALLATHWESVHRGMPGAQMPRPFRIPLYLNPFYFLTVGFGVAGNISRVEWFICLMVYSALALAFSTLSWRAIDQSGEQL